MKKLNADKQEWLQTVVPQWMNTGKEREANYDKTFYNKE